MNNEIIKKAAAKLAFATVIVYVITGYSMTHYQTMEKVTFGLLSKPMAFKIHSWLIVPLVIFLLAHLVFSCPFFNKDKK